MQSFKNILGAAALLGGLAFATGASALTNLGSESFTGTPANSGYTFDIIGAAENVLLSANIGANFIGGGGSLTLLATIYDLTTSTPTTISISPAISVDSNTVSGTASAQTSLLSLAAGHYDVTYTFSNNVNASSITGQSSVYAAVPGPIAGAGLPALLGLMGFFGFRRKNAA